MGRSITLPCSLVRRLRLEVCRELRGCRVEGGRRNDVFGGDAAAECIGLSFADQSWAGVALGCTNIALVSLL